MSNLNDQTKIGLDHQRSRFSVPFLNACVLASAEGVVALDVRVELFESSQTAASLSKLVIRPYPTEYAHRWNLADGTPVTIRPIRPEDEPSIITFHRSLSEKTVHLRYFGFLADDALIAHERLVQICFSDYDREVTLVVETNRAARDEQQIAAVARLIKAYGANEAEIAIVVSDDWQGKGLGTKLLSGVLTPPGLQSRLAKRPLFGKLVGTQIAQTTTTGG